MQLEEITVNNDVNITIVEYKNQSSNSFQLYHEIKYSDLLNQLQTPLIIKSRKSKKTGKTSPVIKRLAHKYKNGTYIFGDVLKNDNYYRDNQHMINKNILALDYDDLTKDDNFLNVIENVLKDVAYCVYSTYRHTPDNPRYRILIPLDEPIEADKYKIAGNIVSGLIPFEIDSRSFDLSRPMCFPVCYEDNQQDYIFKYHDGAIMSTKDLLVQVAKYKEENKITDVKQVRTDDHWNDLLNGINEGGRNETLTSLMGKMMKHFPPTFAYTMTALYNHEFCNPPCSNKELMTIYESIIKREYKF